MGFENDIHHLFCFCFGSDCFPGNQSLNSQLTVCLEGGFNGEFLGAEDAVDDG